MSLAIRTFLSHAVQLLHFFCPMFGSLDAAGLLDICTYYAMRSLAKLNRQSGTKQIVTCDACLVRGQGYNTLFSISFEVCCEFLELMGHCHVTLVFMVMVDGVERLRRVRRRGKELISKPFVATTNERNELGRVQVERHTPFRGATTDVGQCGARCNFDFQFMPRAPVLEVESGSKENLISAAKPDADQGPQAEEPDAENLIARKLADRSKRSLPYDKAEAFYGIRLQLPGNVAMRQAAFAMLAMWQAAHNTDYYITKYGTKALEQLQNLIAQFALGLRRLELQEEQERSTDDVAVLQNPHAYKQRARRVTLRLAMAASRATWTSCCEMALFICTGAHVRKTYFPRQIYLSRLAYLCHTCQRLLRHKDDFLLEASEARPLGTTNLSTLSFTVRLPEDDCEPQASPTPPAASTPLMPLTPGQTDPPSDIDVPNALDCTDATDDPNLANSSGMKTRVQQNLPSAHDMQLRDDDGKSQAPSTPLAPSSPRMPLTPPEADTPFDANIPDPLADVGVLQNLPTTEVSQDLPASHDNGEEEDPSASNDVESNVDADLMQMKTLRNTTSTHDDWLHRGPYLHDIAFHTYAEYVDRVRIPRKPSPGCQLFQFEPHYVLSRTYCQQITTPARLPVLEALKFVPPGGNTAEER